MAEQVIRLTADMVLKDEDGGSALHKAVKNSDLTRINTLLNYTVTNIDETDDFGQTALHVAAVYNADNSHLDTMEMLLMYGANANAQDITGNTPLHYLFMHEPSVQTIELLSNFRADVRVCNNEGYPSLFYAIELFDNIEIAQLFINSASDMNIIDSDGPTILLEACKKCSLFVIEMLLKQGFSVNAQNLLGVTPLHCVVERGEVQKIQFFLARGSDANVQNFRGQTPLYYALRNKNFETVKLLVDYGSDVNVVDDNECTPLNFACINNNDLETIKLLLKKGSAANLNARNSFGVTPLHCLVDKVEVQKIQLLLEHNANANVKNDNGQTPLVNALCKKNFKIVKLLVDHGSDVNDIDDYGSMPMHYACINSDLEIIKFLLKEGACIDPINDENCTPLMTMVSKMGSKSDFKEKLRKLRFLLKYSDVNMMGGGKIVFLSPKIENIFFKHFAKLQALDIPLHSKILEYIQDKFLLYFADCTAELIEAKKIKFENSWITFFNILTDDKTKLKNYAGNKELVSDFHKKIEKIKFPIYGAEMITNMSKGIKRRGFFDESTILLSDCLGIFNPNHLIIKDILDCLSTKNLMRLCNAL